jgi:hypothetical protein
MTSAAKTVPEYLDALPEDRRAALTKVRAVLRKHLPKGFAEQMLYGMICYVVPFNLYPSGYHVTPDTPLPFGGLASQKNYMSVYLWTADGMRAWLEQQFQARGKRLDMGKGCIRFKKLDDLPLDVIGEAFAKVSVADYIKIYESSVRKGR